MQAYDLDALREVAVKVHQLAPGWGEARRASYVKHAVRLRPSPVCRSMMCWHALVLKLQ